jgi:hypothetical protein
LRTLAPELEILAPVRDRAFKRPEQLEYLQSRNLPVPPFGASYSVNRGLWGVTIGGKETLTSWESIPDHAWVLTKDAFTSPHPAERHTIGFEAGVPVSLDGEKLDAVTLLERIEVLGARFGIGRGIHLGDTIIGFKGRVAFEAPAAEVLLTAHRELEKLVLSARQQRTKDQLASTYGDLVHEGQHLDPVCRDIEALFVSSQQRVTGEVHVLFRTGSLFVEGRQVALLVDGRVERRVRRIGRRVDRGRGPRVLEDARAARHLLHTRGQAVNAPGVQPMKTVVVDKIASIAQACGIGHDVRVATMNIPCEEGIVLVVEILTNKSTYNTLELTSGPHGQGRARRHHRRRARSPPGAVRVLRSRAR